VTKTGNKKMVQSFSNVESLVIY